MRRHGAEQCFAQHRGSLLVYIVFVAGYYLLHVLLKSNSYGWPSIIILNAVYLWQLVLHSLPEVKVNDSWGGSTSAFTGAAVILNTQ